MRIVECPVIIPVMRLALMVKVRYIAVHCSASQPVPGYGAAEIDRIHRDRKFKCVGYHYVIRTSGVIERCRPERNVGAHVEGYNSQAIGICLVGGIDSRGNSVANFTPEQYIALRDLLGELTGRYPGAIVQGHRDFPEVRKDCPCFDVRTWYASQH